jgi:glycosyltransferase involved in cell wall biosynthesis
VLHAIHSLSGGGAETQLRLLLNSWPYSDVENGVFFIAGDPANITNPAVGVFPSRQKSTRHLAFVCSLRETILRFDPDVIHIWLPEVVSIPAMFIGRIQGRRVILSYRDRRRFARMRAYLEFGLAVLCVDSIVSNHEVLAAPSYASSVFRWLFKRKQGRVIRNGLQVDSSRAAGESGKRGPGFLFMCVGRLSPAKNYPRLIEAFRLLAERRDWSLNIWGEGESRDELERAVATAKLSDRIFLRGHSSAAQSEMLQASAVIVPSVSEGMPNVLIEAMALGVPVIAADIEGIREVVGNEPACVWIDPLDPLDIASGICAVLDGEVERAALVAQGRLIAARYSVVAMQAAYVDLYRQMLDAS